MTDLVVTATSVSLVSGDADLVIAGEVITCGQLCYLNELDGKWYKATCVTGVNQPRQSGSNALGMALGGAVAINNKIGMARPGSVVQSSAVAAGAIYYVSSLLAGSFGTLADLVATDRTTIAAVSIGSNQLLLTRVFHEAAIV